MAARAAQRPAGTVTKVFGTSAEREAAFRLLESDDVHADAVRKAAFDATARACRELKRIYVPIDGSSLTLTDRAKRRELGRVGNTRVKSRGLQVMSALAIDEQGSALGLLDQRWWTRDNAPKRRRGNAQKCFRSGYLKTETRFWLEALTSCDDRLEEQAPGASPWYQVDRGADCWPVFELALERGLLVTIRSSHDRRLLGPNGENLRLRQELRSQRSLDRYYIHVPRRAGRPARKAHVTIKSCSVIIHARTGSKRREAFTLNAVMVEETQRRGKNRLFWVLLTTHPVVTRNDARAVVHGYTLRWRIEDFHRAWKRGHCNVEQTQLQSRSALIKWATILATVAARALRLAHLLRTSPDISASTEFTEYEIDATFILAKRKRDRRKTVSLRELLEIIADLGGFMGKYSGKLPGPTIIGRGLEQITILARGLQNMAEMR